MSNTNRYGISAAVRQVPCAEITLRNYERKGIVNPERDSAGRRLFSDADIKAAQKYRNSASSK